MSSLPQLSTRGYDTTPKRIGPFYAVDDYITGEMGTAVKSKASPQDNTLENNRHQLIVTRRAAQLNAVKLIVTPLVNRAHEMLSEHELLIPHDVNAAIYTQGIAEKLESLTFNSYLEAGKQAREYVNRIRALNFNLKTNKTLAGDILNGGLEPEKLAIMPTEEMANPDRREFYKMVRKQAEINITLVNTDCPRIRKTHKGEELVESLESSPPREHDDSVFSPCAVGSQDKSPQGVKSCALGTKDNLATQGSKSSPNPWTPKRTLAKSKFDLGSGLNQTPCASNIHYLGESDDCPCSPAYQTPCPISRTSNYKHARTFALQNGTFNPRESQNTEHAWVGRIEMKGTDGFCTTAELVAGHEYVASAKWCTLLDEILHIDGDASPGAADNYLKGLCTSDSTSVILASLSPMDQGDEAGWTALFERFRGMGRYGVVGGHYHECIRGIYVIFLEKGDPLPAWICYLHSPLGVAIKASQSRLILVVAAIIRNQVGI